MNKIVYISLLFFTISCKTNRCLEKNNSLINEFEKNIKIIESLHKSKDTVNIDSYRDALKFLVTTTNIMTTSDYSSTIGYQNDTDFNRDIYLWRKWLKDNSCLKKQ